VAARVLTQWHKESGKFQDMDLSMYSITYCIPWGIETALQLEFTNDEAKYYAQRIVESAWTSLQRDSNGYTLNKLNNSEYSYCAIGSDLSFTVSLSCAGSFTFSSECTD
jgi:hypothetical protein